MPKHGYYAPDAGASPYEPWDIALLSQRDLGLRIPVNYVTNPGISLRAACFAHEIYDADPAAKCISNLLAMGYQRFVIDAYWDTTRSLWSLCPAQMLNATEFSNSNSTSASASTNSTASSGTSVSTDVTVAALAERTVEPVLPFTLSDSIKLQQRQSQQSRTSGSTLSSSATLGPSSSSSLPSAPSNSSADAATATALPGEAGDDSDILVQIGPYQCSTDLNLLFLAEVFTEFLDGTQDIVRAFAIYMTLNLHAAAPMNDAGGSAQQPAPSALPTGSNILSATVNTNLSSYIYTPLDLRNERNNLNDTWFNIPYEAQPDSHYYDLITDQRFFTTQDGWPSESYIEFQLEKRLIVQFGTIDLEMQGYNVSADNGTIFPSNALSTQRNVTFTSSDTIADGCFYDAGSTGVSDSNNNSWATSDVSPSLLLSGRLNTSGVTTFTAVNNLTSCGISPFLNDTLSNVTTDKDFTAYRGIPLSSIWSWSSGEPRNVSANEDDDEHIRCAVMDSTLQGRWRVEECNKELYSACRVRGLPYEWVISTEKHTYSSSADEACAEGQGFSAPRTGLENTYLFRAWQSAAGRTDNDTSLWVNFNSLDQVNCWVAGVNASCPYSDQSQDARARTVIVPTVAAVIIFVLAALTLFVKCAANRRSSKRRRRRKGEDGWDYEGVPS